MLRGVFSIFLVRPDFVVEHKAIKELGKKGVHEQNIGL
jgi:hypothetical protein